MRECCSHHVISGVGKRCVRRREDVDRNAIVGRPVQAAPHDSNRHVPFGSGAFAIGIGTTVVRLARVEDLVNAKLRDDAQATTDVIA